MFRQSPSQSIFATCERTVNKNDLSSIRDIFVLHIKPKGTITMYFGACKLRISWNLTMFENPSPCLFLSHWSVVALSESIDVNHVICGFDYSFSRPKNRSIRRQSADFLIQFS